ncbi:MAG: site-specific integrase [Bacteroidota bacterium]
MARRKGTLKTQAKPADKEDMEEVVLALPDTNAGLRDRVLLLLGFRGAFRRSELAGLDIEDLTFIEAGITIRLRHSKTDKEGKGMYKAISERKRNLQLCPVYNTNRYLEALGRTTGPLFVGTSRGGNFLSNRISGMSIHRILKKHLGNDYSPHSLRSGFVTAARKLDIPDYQIQNQTHHKDIRTLGEYYRPESIWEDNAESKL